MTDNNPTEARLFHLQRDRDLSGISGTGRVADGVLWPDGTVSIRWRGNRPSTVTWSSLADAEHVHGHGGATRIVWAAQRPDSAGNSRTDNPDSTEQLLAAARDSAACQWPTCLPEDQQQALAAEVEREMRGEDTPPDGARTADTGQDNPLDTSTRIPRTAQATAGGQPDTEPHDWSGCRRSCQEQHTYRWGECELAARPEPTDLRTRVVTADDGERSIVVEPAPTPDAGLREQYAAAIVRGGGCVDLAAATEAVLAVRDRRLETTERAYYQALVDLGEASEQAEAAVARVRAAVHVADTEDVTEWQRGYRACSERTLEALDTPAAEQPAVGPNLTPGYVNPPGSTSEQLPAELLAAIDVPPYLSTACDTAARVETATTDDAPAWARQLHQRCRLNNKFTGASCTCTCHS